MYHTWLLSIFEEYVRSKKLCFTSFFLKTVAQMNEGSWEDKAFLGGAGEEDSDLCRMTSVPFSGNGNKDLDQSL